MIAVRRPFLLATTAGAGALAWSATPNLGVAAAVDGAARSSRSIYTMAAIVVDYEYSLRGVAREAANYRAKLSEVHLRSAKRLLKLCEANRGFYVKAGQFLSSSRQVPKEYSSTLSSLQDQATPCRFKDIKEVIVTNFGKDLSEIFLSFDEQPIAAASIAQVHRGLLKDNKEVAIKVQYPGLEQRMKIDLTTMTILSKFVTWIFPDYRFERLVSEFERVIALELDFIQEAKNSERAAKNFKKNKSIRIPLVFWDLTTTRVLTMEYCHGHKVDDLEFLKETGISPIKVAKALMEAFAEMIFVHGFLHGDPHPGNILVSPEGRNGFSLVILDHGFYRELDERFRLDYCRLWNALILMDSKRIQELGQQFGIGNYSKYLPVIFTGRTIQSKSAFSTQMSTEEKRSLKRELHSLKMEDISSFMESLPPDFLTILRTDGLLRSIVGKLGAPRHVRLVAYAKYAVSGLSTHSNNESGFTVKHVLFGIRNKINYLQLRSLIEFLALLSQLEELTLSVARRMKRLMYEVVDFLSGSLLFL